MHTTMQEIRAAQRAADAFQATASSRSIYEGLADPAPSEEAKASGLMYLQQQLAQTDTLASDLPDEMSGLLHWIGHRAAAIGREYGQYLRDRHQGEPRRYFTNRSHALHFLQHVAPTKLVDGAWLYGVMQHWRDPLYRPLVLTYLEELGDGDEQMNHVAMYSKLLAANECGNVDALPDDRFVQGAIQLGLAYHGAQMLPEVIGFNLGYEQLPLHLLITAYELNELGIDPYYFTLHTTIDNASSGHACKAAQVAIDALAVSSDPQQFCERLRRGYLLNELGAGTLQVIQSFDLEQEVVRMLSAKALFGQMMHSDYCRFEGKTVNQWLQDPASTGQFLGALERANWIVRGQDAEQSRFWRLIANNGGEMFGVFDAHERQLLRDWIETGMASERRMPTFRAQARLREVRQNKSGTQRELKISAQTAQRSLHMPTPVEVDTLIPELSPGRHHVGKGLEATTAFSAWYRAGQP